MARFRDLVDLYEQGDFGSILDYENGQYFLMLLSMSRSDILKKFCADNSITTRGKKLEEIFNKNIPMDIVSKFIRKEYREELQKRNAMDLRGQLSRLEKLDWGGLHRGALERTIVDKYVKRVADYEALNQAIRNELHDSMEGYVRSSWYNYWSSILIEDMFKVHENVLPAIGRVKKIDFFWHGMPFDLKVTHFPTEFMKDIRKELGMRVEHTEMREFAVDHKIVDGTDARSFKPAKLQSRIMGHGTGESNAFLGRLKRDRKKIIGDAEQNPHRLAKWMYENQGERRFDAVYRFYLILTDLDDPFASWKMKLDNVVVPQKISHFLDDPLETHVRSIDFEWKRQRYSTKYCVLFVLKNNDGNP